MRCIYLESDTFWQLHAQREPLVRSNCRLGDTHVDVYMCVPLDERARDSCAHLPADPHGFLFLSVQPRTAVTGGDDTRAAERVARSSVNDARLCELERLVNCELLAQLDAASINTSKKKWGEQREKGMKSAKSVVESRCAAGDGAGALDEGECEDEGMDTSALEDTQPSSGDAACAAGVSSVSRVAHIV